MPEEHWTDGIREAQDERINLIDKVNRLTRESAKMTFVLGEVINCLRLQLGRTKKDELIETLGHDVDEVKDD